MPRRGRRNRLRTVDLQLQQQQPLEQQTLPIPPVTPHYWGIVCRRLYLLSYLIEVQNFLTDTDEPWDEDVEDDLYPWRRRGYPSHVEGSERPTGHFLQHRPNYNPNNAKFDRLQARSLNSLNR